MGGERVAVIGGGGRESALVAAYLRSSYVGSVLAIPGNDMMKVGQRGSVETFPKLKTTDVRGIASLCRDRKVSLVDVAQDNAVEAGVVDALQAEGIPAVGPTRSSGIIEWSKAYARRLGDSLSLPQPLFVVCDSREAGFAWLDSQPDGSWFVKADGLHEGKGALPAANKAEARVAIEEVVSFADGSGKTFLIEDWLKNADGTAGEEFSAFGLSDGEHVKMLGYAQDHKRVANFDVGKNTGGTGCSTPPLVLTDGIKSVVQDLFERIVEGLSHDGRPYKGVLYLGGILLRQRGDHGVYIVEWNARWGDPEAQCLIPGIQNDFYELGLAVAGRDIGSLTIRTDGRARVVVAGMSRGYPEDYSAVKGKEIFGLEEAMAMPGVTVFGAGVQVRDGRYLANGGRLFHVVGEGDDVILARQRAYAAISRVSVEGNNLHYRTDIGWRDVQRLRRPA